MKITILCVGKIKEKFYRDAIEEYAKRLTRYCKLEIIEVADEKTPDGASATEEMQISHVIFLIGGSLGMSKELLAAADFKLSFSRMTFPHQLMRVILLEQIYRGYRIMNREPYHK